MDCNRGTQRITTKYLLNTYYVKLLCPIWLACGEGNGTLLQDSCLENPMDGGAWKASVHGVTRVRHNWATSLSLFTFMHWGRKWQPTPVFLPGESQGRGSLLGCCLWGRAESDTSNLAAAAAVYWLPHFMLIGVHLYMIKPRFRSIN